MNNRLLIFDLMRSLAILIILFHHLPNYTGNFYDLNFIGINLDLSPLNELNRYLGLGLFIFLAGYLINRKRERFADKRSAINFLYRKFIRIFPLYYLALFCFILIHKIYAPLKIGVQILGLQLLFASSTLKPIHTLWFIGLIVIYYYLFTVLNYNPIKKFYKGLIIILFPICIWILLTLFKVTDSRLILYYWVFLGGVFCAETNFFESEFWRKFNSLIPIVFVPVFLISFFLEKQYKLITTNSSYSYLLINLLIFTFVLFIYQISTLISRKNSSLKLIQIVSYASYCMFLFHRPIWFSMSYVLKQTLGINYSIAALILLFVGIPVVIIISYYIQRFYDEHCMKLLPKDKLIK